eukprot:5333635-Prymnesium_polylepis.1
MRLSRAELPTFAPNESASRVANACVDASRRSQLSPHPPLREYVGAVAKRRRPTPSMDLMSIPERVPRGASSHLRLEGYTTAPRHENVLITAVSGEIRSSRLP